MKLQLRGLVVQGFKCYTRPVKLDFKLLPSGLHFVRGENKVQPSIGSNGSGKSSLFEAICWALYGRTSNGLRNPDIIPWDSDGQVWVGVSLKVDDKFYRIVRTVSPNSLSVNKEAVGQDQIDHDIMSFSVFTNTLLLGQGRPLFFDLTPQGKLDLFVDVLDLNRWDARSQIAAEETKRLENRQIELETELRVAEKAYTDMKSWLKELKIKRDRWEVENKGKRKELMAEASRLSARKEKLKNKGEEFSKALELSKARLKEESEDLRTMEREYVKIENLRDSAKSELSRLEQQLLDLREAKVCPTCGQPVKKKDLSKHRNELSDKIAEFRLLIKDPRFGQLKHDIDVATDLVNGTQKVVREDESKLIELTAEFQEVKAQHAACEARLEEVDVDPYEESIKGLRSGIKENKEKRAELVQDLSKLRRRLGRVKFWIKGFRACRLYLIEEVLDELRVVTNSICPELGLENWEIDYHVERETKSGTIARGLNVTVKSPETEKPVKWESYSGGERQRLRLAGALALSETLLTHAGIEADFSILDEPTRSLSSVGVDDLCEALSAYATRLERRVFYVDHMATESSSFSSTLAVLRTLDGVRVEFG